MQPSHARKGSAMEDVKVAAAQFAPKQVDKEANLAKIAELTAEAAQAGAKMVCFQEQAVSGYGLWSLGSSNERAGGAGRMTTSPIAGRNCTAS